jgi:hypothetical protein
MRTAHPARVLLVLAAIAAVPGGARAATWDAPVALSDSVAFTDDIQLVRGSDGRVLAVWDFGLGSGIRGAEAASRLPDGRWGPRRALGTTLPPSGGPAHSAGVGSSLFGIAAFGADRWLGLAGEQFAAARLQWWTGTTVGSAHRGGTLPERPWETGPVAAFPDGAAVLAWTTMRPRRGAGSSLRPRVVVVARGSRSGFGRPRRLSPLPPGPPYGNGRGPALSATALTTAAGGRGTVVVAWQRTGHVEARVSRDRGRSFGPVRRLGPSHEAFPTISARVSAAGKVLVAWGARVREGGSRALVERVAIAAPGRRFAPTRLLEHSAPLASGAPQATDQRGPSVLVGFDGEQPLAAWQTVVDGHAAVRSKRLQGAAMPATFTAPGGEDAVLDDLAIAPAGGAALAWHTVGTSDAPNAGFVARAAGGGAFGDVQQVPGAPGASGLRVACDAQGVLVAWDQRTGPTSTVLAAQLR